MAVGNTEHICPHNTSPGYRRWIKRAKAKKERRRAKKNPECTPEYRRYWGYTL